MSTRIYAVAALCLLFPLAGCIEAADPGDDAPAARDAPEDLPDVGGCTPPEVSASTGSSAAVANYPGSFSYSEQSAAKTGSEVYLWENPSNGAMVQWGTQTATGSFTLTVQDHCGNEVYSRQEGPMSQSGASETTQRGMPGTWILTFEFALYTGQIGLQVTSG